MTVATYPRMVRSILVSSFLVFWVVLAPTITLAQAETVRPSKRPDVANVTMTNANTEYSFAFPGNTTRFRIAPRGGSMQIAWRAATTGATYWTIPNGGEQCEKDVLLSVGGAVDRVYFRTGSAGTVVEIQYWQ